MQEQVNVFWFRRDLRLNDNAGLYHALKEGVAVLPLFIFDTNILDDLEDRDDGRVHFIHNILMELNNELSLFSSGIEALSGKPTDVFSEIIKRYKVGKVFANHDYETYARDRDESIRKLLEENGSSFHTFKDQVIFDRNEILKEDGSPYLVFTPYSRKWKAKLNDFYLKEYPTAQYFSYFYKKLFSVPSLEEIGFRKSNKIFPSKDIDNGLIKAYSKERDFPGVDGTSRLGIHLRFGTISIRKVVMHAKDASDAFLNELIWREFYQMILWHFPRIGKGEAFKKEYDRINWRHNEKEFVLWCHGMTGYPIVDACMRELNETGYMHNRVRMITASFLTKHLLTDWRWGEAYFAGKLLDFDFASNNGGWQWASGSGCDAAPYFRIFNPTIQTRKFDPELKYVKRWVPELDTFDYPQPIVEHEFARERCLTEYKRVLTSP